jgi:hypothetical protein
MVQILPARRTFGAEFGRALGGGFSQGVSKQLERQEEEGKLARQQKGMSELYKKMTGEELPADLPPEVAKDLFVQTFKNQGKQKLQENELNFLSNIVNKGQGNQQGIGDQLAGIGLEAQGLPANAAEMLRQGEGQPGQRNVPVEGHAGFDPRNLTAEDILQGEIVKPGFGKTLQQMKDSAISEDLSKAKEERRQFEDERKYHTEKLKDTEKYVNQLRDTLPKKEMALDFARNAVETGNLGYFSLDRLADATGQDIFRTAKGAQLLTAGKENLLTNMARVGAKAQNQWFEQRLNSMFAKIGQSKEANLTVQEMIEGELAMDQAYLSEYDRLSEEDMKNYGFVKSDIGKRVQSALKPLNDEIFNRTAHRMKEIEEQEKGLKAVKAEVGKNVPKGTPWTLAMAKLYLEEYGDDAEKVAKKNGYRIPTFEEYKTYRTIGREFREGLTNE